MLLWEDLRSACTWQDQMQATGVVCLCNQCHVSKLKERRQGAQLVPSQSVVQLGVHSYRGQRTAHVRPESYNCFAVFSEKQLQSVPSNPFWSINHIYRSY